jgi:hypothetical protein
MSFPIYLHLHLQFLKQTLYTYIYMMCKKYRQIDLWLQVM